MPPTHAVSQKRAKVAALKRHRPNDTQAVNKAVSDLHEIMLREHIEEVLGQAPPLSDQQKARLAALLRGGE